MVVVDIIVQRNAAAKQQPTTQKYILKPGVGFEITTQKRQRNGQKRCSQTMNGTQHAQCNAQSVGNAMVGA